MKMNGSSFSSVEKTPASISELIINLSPTEINALRGCAAVLREMCQLMIRNAINI